MQAPHKILRGLLWNIIQSPVLRKEWLSPSQDPMVQSQLFPHCEDEFYPSKTLCSTFMVAKQPLD